MDFLNKTNRASGRFLQGNSWCLLLLWLSCSSAFSTAGAADGSFGVAVKLPERMRGITSSERDLNANFFEMLAKTDANVLRVGFSKDANAVAPTAQNPLLPYTNSLALLDAALPLAKAQGIKIILCASETYGWSRNLWTNNAAGIATYRTNLANFWGAMALRYAKEPTLVAYDILNEPVLTSDTGRWYTNVLPASVAAIRAVNTNIWLVVECAGYALPSNMSVMPLLTNDTRVIYSIHFYNPHSYCQQGAGRYPKYTATYPGTNSMWGDTNSFAYWDKETLRAQMSAAINFSQANTNARIVVGEFGVARWAPGADQWLADSIALFEEYGWDWCNLGIGSGGAQWSSITYSTNKSDPQYTNTASDGGYRGASWQVLSKGWSLNLNPGKGNRDWTQIFIKHKRK